MSSTATPVTETLTPPEAAKILKVSLSWLAKAQSRPPEHGEIAEAREGHPPEPRSTSSLAARVNVLTVGVLDATQ